MQSVVSRGEKKTIHMKHSSMHVGDLIMVIIPSFSTQCSLGMWIFEIELRVKIPLHIIIVLHH